MMNKKRQGYTLLEIMIVVAIIGMLAIITYPAFARARQATQTTACLDRLRQIDGAKSQFALENNRRQGDAVTQADIDVYLKRTAQVFVEPSGGAYSINAVGTDPTCTNFNPDHPATL